MAMVYIDWRSPKNHLGKGFIGQCEASLYRYISALLYYVLLLLRKLLLQIEYSDPFRIVRFLGLKTSKAKIVADTGDNA